MTMERGEGSSAKRILLVHAAGYFPESEKAPPLGLLYLASYLRARTDVEVRIVDMQLNYRDETPVVRAAEEARPVLVGISAMTANARQMHMVARRIKERLPDVPVVVGGAHPSSYPEETLQDPTIDFLVAGEGEEPLLKLVRWLEGGEQLENIRGLSYRVDGTVVSNPPMPYHERLDDLPFPCYDLVPLEEYHRLPRVGVIFARKRYATMISSRGCPYRCAYCHNIHGKRNRVRSPENVVAEIEELVGRFGIGEIVFVEDMFNLYPERTREIARRIVAAGLDIRMSFPIGLRGDIMDEETVKLLKDAGMYRCMYAIETASPRLQRLIRKNLDVDKVLGIIEKTARMGILTHGAFMLGFPTETAEEARHTVDAAVRSSLHTAAFYRVVPFKGTYLAELAEADGKEIERTFERFEFHKTKLNVSRMSDEVLDRCKKSAYRRFYLDPRRMVRTLRLLPNKTEIIPELVRIFIRKAFVW